MKQHGNDAKSKADSSISVNTSMDIKPKNYFTINTLDMPKH